MSGEKQSWPEIIFTVAEHSLNKSPLFLGLTGAQLSRIAREAYSQLKKSGHLSLARQAEALIDPNALSQALRATVHQHLNSSSDKHTRYPVCPCCVVDPNCTSCICLHKTDIVPVHVNPPTAFVNVSPSHIGAQPCNFWRTVPTGQLNLIPNANHVLQEMEKGSHLSNVCVMTGQNALPKSHTNEMNAAANVSTSGESTIPGRADDTFTSGSKDGTTRKFCVARLLFALVAAKVAAEYCRIMQSGSGGRADGGGIGGVSMENMVEAGKAVTASLWPRKGLLAVHKHIIKRLQESVSSALASLHSSIEAPTIDGDKAKDSLPPIYMSHAPHGRKELTLHEKASTEEIRKLLNIRNARSVEAIGLVDKTYNASRGSASDGVVAQPVVSPSSQGSVQQGATGGEAETKDSLDAEFRSFVKRAREHQGSATLSIEDQLRFYGLYKRAVSGPCRSERPSRFNVREFKKWEAWNSCSGMTADEAKSEYVRRARQIEKLHIGGRL